MNNRRIIFLVLFISTVFICGWGASGHKIINRRSVYSFPSQMNFLNWSDSLAAHSSDADYRRSDDSTEAPRHFIDIDDYPEFISTGRIPQDMDSLIALHGSSFVYDKGILPFSIIATVDSVKKYFQLHNFQRAMLHAADLGHYVGDGHNPLHITRNYNGQFTNQNGVHSRYESQLINRDSGNIIYSFQNAVYVSNINQFVFDFIYFNYTYVDSVLKCDSIAHSIAQSYNSNYYQIYWQLAGSFTTMLFNNASHFISSLIYTSWVNSGSPVLIATTETSIPQSNLLKQNYPNPFNPSTKIKFDVPRIYPESNAGIFTRISVYDISGKEITTLLNEKLQPGSYEVEWNAVNYPSGTYIYKLSTDYFTDSKRMLLIK